MKSTRIRTLVFVCVVALSLFGLIGNVGLGTLCSFGYEKIASICPLGGLEQMIASHTFVPGVLVGLAVFFVLCVLFGRFFCGWICPVPNLRRWFSSDKNPQKDAAYPKFSEKYESPTLLKPCKDEKDGSESACGACASRQESLGASAEKAARSLPYVVLGGTLLSTAVFGIPVFCLICPVGLFFAFIIGLWQLVTLNEIGWSLPVIVLILALEVFVFRRWCHKFCPLGALISLMASCGRFFRPSVDPAACLRSTHSIACSKCRSACPENLDLHSKMSALAFARCIKCRQCADACPEHAISFPFFERKTTAKATPSKPDSGAAFRCTPEAAEEKTLTANDVQRLASRCLECGKCIAACPMHNPIPQWLSLAAQGKFIPAARLLFLPGTMPEICSRLCPQERLCESACPLAETGRPIPIGALSRFVADNYLAKGRYAVSRHRKPRASAAVVGAGPCGLACADVLNAQGVRVVVFDRHDAEGGLLRYAIPDFRLDKHLIADRRALLEKAGIEFRFRQDVGKDVPISRVLQEFDAVFISTGASCSWMPNLPGIDDPHVEEALSYLEKACRVPQRARDEVCGRRVAVLGAGDTAMDVLETALKNEADEAVCICRKAREDVRAGKREVETVIRDGARFMFDTDVLGFESEDEGVAVLLKDRITACESRVVFDRVYVAYGLRPADAPWLQEIGVVQLPDGRIRIAENYQTDNPAVFAGGDAVRGSSLAVKGVLDGRRAASEIVAWLKTAKGRQA